MKYSLDDERASQSEFSPKLVEDKEDLLRWHFHPEHFKDGNILPAAVTITDLAQNGLSIDRHKYAFKDRILKEIERMQNRSPERRELAFIQGKRIKMAENCFKRIESHSIKRYDSSILEKQL